MKGAKDAPPLDDRDKVWCVSCYIRIAPNEERIMMGAKAFHTGCYSKLNQKLTKKSQ